MAAVPWICELLRCRRIAAMSSAWFVLAVLLLASPGIAQPISIQAEGGSYKVTGWTPNSQEPEDGWSSIFAVYAGIGDLPPMLGSYAIEQKQLVFHPRYPVTNIRVRATFRLPDSSPVEAIFEPTKKSTTSTTRVQQVFPSAEVLPENQLKFYVQFSAPMQRGDAWRHIHLLDQRGSAIDLPFLELDQEL